MTPEMIFTSLALGLELLITVVIVVWILGKISASVTVLNSQLEMLSKSIDELRNELRKESERGDQHSYRIGRLEGKASNG